MINLFSDYLGFMHINTCAFISYNIIHYSDEYLKELLKMLLKEWILQRNILSIVTMQN